MTISQKLIDDGYNYCFKHDQHYDQFCCKCLNKSKSHKRYKIISQTLVKNHDIHEIKSHIKLERRIAIDSKHLLTTYDEVITLNERIKLCEQLLNWLHIPLKDWG